MQSKYVVLVFPLHQIFQILAQELVQLFKDSFSLLQGAQVAISPELDTQQARLDEYGLLTSSVNGLIQFSCSNYVQFYLLQLLAGIEIISSRLTVPVCFSNIHVI